MIRSLSTAVSGLRGHQIKFDVIGNNIANVNTVAFKKSQARFEDLLSQTIQGATAPLTRGGINPFQVGMGMRVSVINNHFQGSIQTTDRQSDLAIEGAGFFVVHDGREQYFTRDGSFGRDANGMLVNTSGHRLMGWMGGGGVGGELLPLHIPLGERMVAQPTSRVYFAGNLDARAWQNPVGEVQSLNLGGATGGTYSLGNAGSSVTLNWNDSAGTVQTALESIYGAGNVTVEAAGALFRISFAPAAGDSGLLFSDIDLVGAVNPALGLLQAYEPGATEADRHAYEQSVFDSLGRRYFVEFIFTPTGVNSWNYEALIDGASIGSGTLVFNEQGLIDQAASSTDPLIYLPAGAEPMEIMIDFQKSTQLAGLNTLLIREQDGFPSGELVSYHIGRTGEITGTYSNGMVEQLGQIAMAFFSNPEGLLKEGGNLYQVSSNSGEARIGAPGTEGRGLIQSSSLEMSNTDLSFEFTEMITTSRAFQANTRVITTSDEILLEVINMKR